MMMAEAELENLDSSDDIIVSQVQLAAQLHDADGNPSVLPDDVGPKGTIEPLVSSLALGPEHKPEKRKSQLYTKATGGLRDDDFGLQTEREHLRRIHDAKYTFNWFLGVFIPVFVNVICVTYFMDLHRSVAQIGWGWSLLLYFISFCMSLGTLTSICVIATNGEMDDGGCYYLVSRTLGPKIGGALGITLIIAHATAISWKLHYVALEITEFYGRNPIFGSDITVDQKVWHVCLSILVFLLCIPGAGTIIYILAFLAAIIVVSMITIFIGFFVRKAGVPSFFTGFSSDIIRANFASRTMNTWELWMYLGVLFPSSNAVMTCANFGGRLKKAGRAIPVGGFSVMFVSAFIILVTILLQAGTFSFDTENHNQVSPFMLLDVSICPPLAYAGLFAACIASSLTMNTGGARILKSMVSDKLLPAFFGKWVFKEEPLGPHLWVTLIALIFAIVDDPMTSTKITNVIFLVPFCLINWAVWTAASAHYPGFRPSFKFYNRWIALVLSILCFLRMWAINWVIALIVLPVVFIIYYIYKRINPEDVWGTVNESRVFYTTLKEELNLYHIKPHVKTYRPNIILITRLHPDKRRGFIDFLNEMLHGHGMAAIGTVFVSDEEMSFQDLVEQRDSTFLTGDEGYRTFYDVTIASSFTEGARDLLLLMGIGMMRPNTLCLAYPEKWQEPDAELEYTYEEFVTAIGIAFDATYSVVVLRRLNLFPECSRSGTIDVWWLSDDGGLTLLLPYLLSQHKKWRKAKLRVMSIAYTSDSNNITGRIEEAVTAEEIRMKHLLYKFRIRADVIVQTIKPNDEIMPNTLKLWEDLMDQLGRDKHEIDEKTRRYMLLTDLMRTESMFASFVAVTMTVPHGDLDAQLYMSWLELISSIKPPVCFIRGNGETVLSCTV